MSLLDNKFMAQALKLAALGGRAVAPNPMVGAVIVKNGKVIGKGYHKKFGGPHAEVNAINSVKNKKDLIGATIYVTLEPCRHWGKTPPCLGLIESVGITSIMCGSRDPFQQKLKTLNSKLKTNIKPQTPNSKLKIIFLKNKIADKCFELNKFFFTWVEKNRPFITVKIAVSADGFVAGKNGKRVHITSKAQDIQVHKLRAMHQAILVGSNTVINDDPQLNVRLVKGPDPLRIILDSKKRVPKTAKVFKDKNVLIVTSASEGAQSIARLRSIGIPIWISPTKKHVLLRRLFRYLAEQGISSVLVEPGPTLYKVLKKLKLIDELIVFTGNKKIGKGIKLVK
jgi:diaminohydroxyphosphoribosylaminopyrimidine deaminase / 5-amino-6-(5-phosphoribosylamino)uracil reductase